MSRHSIQFPDKIKPSTFKLLRDIGLREIVILVIGGVIALFLFLLMKDIFGIVGALLPVSLFVVLVLVAVLVPFRGYNLEKFLYLWLKSFFIPTKYIHKTAYADVVDVATPREPVKPEQKHQEKKEDKNKETPKLNRGRMPDIPVQPRRAINPATAIFITITYILLISMLALFLVISSPPKLQ